MASKKTARQFLEKTLKRVARDSGSTGQELMVAAMALWKLELDTDTVLRLKSKKKDKQAREIEHYMPGEIQEIIGQLGK